MGTEQEWVPNPEPENDESETEFTQEEIDEFFKKEES